MEKILLPLRNLNERLKKILLRCYAVIYWFLLDVDYIAAYVAFCWMIYHMIKQDPTFFSDMLLFFICVALFVLRRMNKLFNKINAIETALNGAKIKRIELEIQPKE